MKRKITFICIYAVILLLTSNIIAQTSMEWKEDIDILTKKIEQYHPMPWARISQQQFEDKADEIKSNLKIWDNEKITLEILKLVASIKDGHTQVLLDNQDNFNLWFPVRIDLFNDGLFITGIEKNNAELVGAKVLKIGNYDSEYVIGIVSGILAIDSDFGIA
ncbi:MAG: hypothetical protein KKG99_07525, partial [Bacteroidetes bacterium]|nr:hypothetical protein [Bacteroidota bacterium]